MATAWTSAQEATIVAALAFYYLHAAETAGIYEALVATNPDSDWETWRDDADAMRAKMRTLQSGFPLDSV
jgi:hypothetical protein